MTHQDYENKKAELNLISNKRFISVEEKERAFDLVLEISLYEANNGLVDENEFNEPK